MSIPVLAAPTASGKSSVALELAQLFPIEIVSADAMLVYKHLDIGTAKPTAQEQQRVPHHMLDVVMPDEAFSVGDYVRQAEAVMADIVARGKLPFVVGGTGFYVRALAEGLPTVPTADFAIQQPFWDRFEQEGLEPLHEELKHFSPQDAERSQKNPRRVVRALEIIKRTGRAPVSFENTKPAFSYDKVVLLPSLDILKPRIEQRTHDMLESGWVNEVRHLLTTYPSLATAKQALGYDTIATYLKGDLSLEESKDLIIHATTKFAKRQRTWFRKEPEAKTLALLAKDAKDELSEWLEERVSREL